MKNAILKTTMTIIISAFASGASASIYVGGASYVNPIDFSTGEFVGKIVNCQYHTNLKNGSSVIPPTATISVEKNANETLVIAFDQEDLTAGQAYCLENKTVEINLSREGTEVIKRPVYGLFLKKTKAE